VREGDRSFKYCPQNALVARRCGERALISEKVTEVLWEHGAYIQVTDIHGLTCKEQEKKNTEKKCIDKTHEPHRIKSF